MAAMIWLIQRFLSWRVKVVDSRAALIQLHSFLLSGVTLCLGHLKMFLSILLQNNWAAIIYYAEEPVAIKDFQLKIQRFHLTIIVYVIQQHYFQSLTIKLMLFVLEVSSSVSNSNNIFRVFISGKQSNEQLKYVWSHLICLPMKKVFQLSLTKNFQTSQKLSVLSPQTNFMTDPHKIL